MLKAWDKLPVWMQIPEVKEYYDILAKRKISLAFKRGFDFFAAIILLIFLMPVMCAVAIAIVFDSPGGIFYRQVRVTTYGRRFRIHKFRTMVQNADQLGSQVTVGQDNRVTKVGKVLRKYRLDELPQLFDVISGAMSFVGTRPEVPRYVKKYTREMIATLLLPAGITSETSIYYKDEAGTLGAAGENVEEVYIKKVLPGKMKYNLEGIRKFGFLREIWVMVRTIGAVVRG